MWNVHACGLLSMYMDYRWLQQQQQQLQTALHVVRGSAYKNDEIGWTMVAIP